MAEVKHYWCSSDNTDLKVDSTGEKCPEGWYGYTTYEFPRSWVFDWGEPESIILDSRPSVWQEYKCDCKLDILMQNGCECGGV